MASVSPAPCFERAKVGSTVAFCRWSSGSTIVYRPREPRRRSRVRQRPSTRTFSGSWQRALAHPTAAELRSAPTLRTEKRNGKGWKEAHQAHLLGDGPVRVPRSSSRSKRTTSRGVPVNMMELQQTITAAGKRKRWEEVLFALDSQEKHRGRLDTKTYNIALSALSKCGRYREALEIVYRMRAVGIPPDVCSWNSVISACGRAGQWRQALGLLSDMERDGSDVRPDRYSYNGAIDAVAKAGRSTEALELLERMKSRGVSPDVISFTSSMSACDRSGQWQDGEGQWQRALSLLEDVISKGLAVNAHVYGSAVHACVRGGQCKRALALLEEMIGRGVVPDVVVFTAAIRAVDDWAAALRLLEAMKDAGVQPDLVAYNAALSVVARSGRVDVALSLLRQMRIEGCSPDVISFNTAIDACASGEKWEEAVRLLEVDMPAAKVKPDVVSYTSAIHACAGPAGNWEKAYQLLDGMWQDERGPKPNKRTYDLLIQACGYGGEWELGVALIDDMRDLSVKPDAQTFNIAAAACARCGERLAAETLVSNMWRLGVTPDKFSYASVVNACRSGGEWRRAIEVFDQARYVYRLRPTLQIYGALLCSLSDAERWSDVLVYFDRMVADGIIPDAVATNTGVVAAAKLGQGLRALALLNGELPSPGARGTDAAAQTARCPSADARRNTPVPAEKSREETGSEEGDTGTGLGPGGWDAANSGLITTVLHALEDSGEGLAVVDVVEQGRGKGSLFTAGIYRFALRACGNLGDYERAKALLAQMTEDGFTPDLTHWNLVLHAAVEGRRWREARADLWTMQHSNVTPDQLSFCLALKACSAGLWSGDSWMDNKWGPTREDCRRSPESNSKAFDPRTTATKSRASNAIEILHQMDNNDVNVCVRSCTLAMAACLEGYRDRCADVSLESPPEEDLRFAETALSIFDRLVKAGEMPTGSTYALALKACARTANKERASALLSSMLTASAHDDHARRGAPSRKRTSLEVRPWHLASAIAAYDAAGDWPGAHKLWHEALRKGIRPRSPGYAAVIAAAFRAGDVTAGRSLLFEARRLRLDVATGTSDLLAHAFGGRQAGELGLWTDCKEARDAA